MSGSIRFQPLPISSSASVLPAASLDVELRAKIKVVEDRVDALPLQAVHASPGLRWVSGLLLPTLDEREKRITLHRQARRAMARGMAVIRLAGEITTKNGIAAAFAVHAHAAEHWQRALDFCKKDGPDTFRAQLAKFALEYAKLAPTSGTQPQHPIEEMVKHEAWDTLKVIAPHLGHMTRWGSIKVSHKFNARLYVGQCNSSGKAHGKGFALYADGGWDGADQWSEGNLAGRGARFYTDPADGGRVDGTFENHKAHGPMTVHYSDGRVMQAACTDGKAHGRVVVTFPNGDRLEAHIKAQEQLLSFTYSEARFYHGQGVWEYDGAVNRRGLPEGRGTFYFANGGRLEGTARQGQPFGGVYTFGAEEALAGFNYLGPWMNGKKHGAGALVDVVTETRHACRFYEDELMTPAPTPAEMSKPQGFDSVALEDLAKAVAQLLEASPSATTTRA